MFTPVITLNSSPAIWLAVPMPAEAKLSAPGLRLAWSTKLGNGLHRNRWIDFHDVGHAHHASDGSHIAEEIEAELVIERGVDRGRGRDHEQRVAVGGRLHDRLGGDVAGGARPGLDDELLAQPLR